MLLVVTVWSEIKQLKNCINATSLFADIFAKIYSSFQATEREYMEGSSRVVAGCSALSFTSHQYEDYAHTMSCVVSYFLDT